MDIIEYRMDVCVELRDAFTGLPIEAEGVCVRVNGMSPVMVKENRYFIFQKTGTGQMELTVKAPAYEERSCMLSGSDCQNETGICYRPLAKWLLALLYPNETYTLPKGYERKIVEGIPKQEIRIRKDWQRPLFLQRDYQGESSICMQGDSEKIGMSFRIMGAGGESEDFTIADRREAGQFLLEDCLRGRYPKGSRIYELYCVRADEEGKAVVIARK